MISDDELNINDLFNIIFPAINKYKYCKQNITNILTNIIRFFSAMQNL